MQDTVQEMAKNMKSSKTGATQASAAELYDFMKRVGAPSFSHFQDGSKRVPFLPLPLSMLCPHPGSIGGERAGCRCARASR